MKNHITTNYPAAMTESEIDSYFDFSDIRVHIQDVTIRRTGHGQYRMNVSIGMEYGAADETRLFGCHSTDSELFDRYQYGNPHEISADEERQQAIRQILETVLQDKAEEISELAEYVYESGRYEEND